MVCTSSPPRLLRKEMAFYRTKHNAFGLPLDCRRDYTKLDWTLWTATLTQNRADFTALVDPVYGFLNETPNRVPMTDWYDTKTAKHVGFQARSVVGGVFLQMLYDRAGWKQWAGRDVTKAANWAPFPKPPKTVVVVPTSEKEPLTWRYTTQAPRRLVQARVRRLGLERRSGRFWHPGHARRGGADRLEHARHLAAARVHDA